MSLTQEFLKFSLLGAEWVLWLLVVLSVLSVYVMIERAMFFRQISGADAEIRRKLISSLTDGDLDAASSCVKNAAGPGGRMVREMLHHADRGSAAIDAAMNAVRPEERVRMGRNLSFLGTLGANAPFIGLFGTVLGIIKAFKDLAETGLQPGGETSAGVMAGISEALVATAVGLLVAIPAVVAYNIFQRRVKRTLGEAESLANTARSYIAGTLEEK
ncbi:MAG: MotA/TolQ/ExbB proton channel family protein [Deltaproteobacteria bacterium]|nr:MotA/TolQ/ExbB proton channel family protein [Deltaproteobacteria bacterium]